MTEMDDVMAAYIGRLTEEELMNVLRKVPFRCEGRNRTMRLAAADRLREVQKARWAKEEAKYPKPVKPVDDNKTLAEAHDDFMRSLDDMWDAPRPVAEVVQFPDRYIMGWRADWRRQLVAEQDRRRREQGQMDQARTLMDEVAGSYYWADTSSKLEEIARIAHDNADVEAWVIATCKEKWWPEVGAVIAEKFAQVRAARRRQDKSA
jgi:hypothetical protein